MPPGSIIEGDVPPIPNFAMMLEFDPNFIRAACADGDKAAIEDFSTALSGNLVNREKRIRQGETHLVVRGEFLPDSLSVTLHTECCAHALERAFRLQPSSLI